MPGEGAAQEPGDARNEPALAREIRAREIVAGRSPARIAAIIRRQCEPIFGTTWIRAYRLALGIALADVVAQVRARDAAEGRPAPRFSETLLSAYESAQKRPGPEYLHYLCAIYQAEPQDLGYRDPCFCGHRLASGSGHPHASGSGHRHASESGHPHASESGHPHDDPGAGAPSAVAGFGPGALRTGSASNAATWHAPGRGAVGIAGARGATGRGLSAL